ncbi:uncharacterized protein LOC111360340 [Spodoptera litura]|uniref:Uncharacterized protein LOC111360340 n=1 Tax=Spodoptera litura TaxID=69820 RepID=A0A9J7J2F1_SPOLT|nr:uncharacterized protein LOC111360340 [Spodoptera litura]
MESGEDEDGNDIEILLNCEKDYDESLDPKITRVEMHKESEKKTPEKRKEREDDLNDEDDFITVNRRKKILIRSNSAGSQNQLRVDSEKKDDEMNNFASIEVCVTSLENLPKQMAFARLLRCENIKNVTRIKYKSVNKVLIQFQEKEDATKLMECQKFKDMGWRCQLLNEMTLSYGVVKGVDLELKENDIMDILECSTEIVSVKRLRRFNSENKWIDCESIRVCFRSNNLPSHIYAYDCRLKVDPYVFPVTQCSGCWQFGHVLKYCPTKKKICPKCGGNHANCDISNISCLNCKGNHFVLDKKCPLYLKEKDIRNIMSTEQVPYRKALQLLLGKQQETTISQNTMQKSSLPTNPLNESQTYSSVLIKTLQKRRPEKPSHIIQEKEGSDVQWQQNTTNKSFEKKTNKHMQSKKNQSQTDRTTEKYNYESFPSQSEDKDSQKDKELLERFELKKFLIIINRIFTSEGTFEEKILLLFKNIFEELKKFVFNLLLKGNWLDNIIEFINA